MKKSRKISRPEGIEGLDSIVRPEIAGRGEEVLVGQEVNKPKRDQKAEHARNLLRKEAIRQRGVDRQAVVTAFNEAAKTPTKESARVVRYPDNQPLPQRIMELIVGGLLSDGSLKEKVGGALYTLMQGGANAEFLRDQWREFNRHGMCSDREPVVMFRGGLLATGLRRRSIVFNTWTYASLRWVFESFYPLRKVLVGNEWVESRVKIVPE